MFGFGINRMTKSTDTALASIVSSLKNRIVADSGSIDSTSDLDSYVRMAKANGIYDSIKLGILGAYNLRISGNTDFVTKTYDINNTKYKEKINLYTYTNDLDNAINQKIAVTVTPNVTNNPYGILDADAVYESTDLTYHRTYQSINVISGTTYTTSAFVKKINTRQYIYIRLQINSNNINVGFDLNSGSITYSNQNYVARITELSDGWFRISTTFTPTTTSSSYSIYYSFSDIPVVNDNIVTYSGSTSEGFYIWGLQLEKNTKPTEYQRVIESSSWDGNINDTTQTTATSQPILNGFIAPNEKWGFKNPIGVSRYLTHPTINFASNEPWSVSVVLTNNTINTANNDTYFLGSKGTQTNLFGIQKNLGVFRLRTNSNISANGNVNINTKNNGKIFLLTIVANGTSFDIYLNGEFIENVLISGTDFTFNTIIDGYSASYDLNGTIYSLMIRDTVLTQRQISNEATWYKSHGYLGYDSQGIRGVNINNIVWQTSNCEMTSTPFGTVITNVSGSTNTEKIINGGFDSTSGWTTTGSATIADGVGYLNATNDLIYQSFTGINNYYYKLTYTVVTSNNLGLAFAGGTGFFSTSIDSSIGTHTLYLKSASSGSGALLIKSNGFIGTVDNISCQSVGWSDSQNIYDYIYGITTGTTEQKTYAAVKAAGMWSYYNNDALIGAIYGNLYNWFAVKLLQMDIDYYNAANPTTPWGWRVPTQADYNTLSSESDAYSSKYGDSSLWGGSSVTGSNANGLTLFGAYRRNETGAFTSFSYDSWLISEQNTASSYNLRAELLLTQFTVAASVKGRGLSLRLIKS